MMTRSANGMSMVLDRIARACSVWIEATCTEAIGRSFVSSPAWMMPCKTPRAVSLSEVWFTISRRWATASTRRGTPAMMAEVMTVLPAPVGATSRMDRSPRSACRSNSAAISI